MTSGVSGAMVRTATAAQTRNWPGPAGTGRRRRPCRAAGAAGRVCWVMAVCLVPEGLVPVGGDGRLLVHDVLGDRDEVRVRGRDLGGQVGQVGGAAGGGLEVVHRRLKTDRAHDLLARGAVDVVEEQLGRGR